MHRVGLWLVKIIIQASKAKKKHQHSTNIHHHHQSSTAGKKKPPTQILNLFPQPIPNKNHKQNKKSTQYTSAMKLGEIGDGA